MTQPLNGSLDLGEPAVGTALGGEFGLESLHHSEELAQLTDAARRSVVSRCRHGRRGGSRRRAGNYIGGRGHRCGEVGWRRGRRRGRGGGPSSRVQRGSRRASLGRCRGRWRCGRRSGVRETGRCTHGASDRGVWSGPGGGIRRYPTRLRHDVDAAGEAAMADGTGARADAVPALGCHHHRVLRRRVDRHAELVTTSHQFCPRWSIWSSPAATQCECRWRTQSVRSAERATGQAFEIHRRTATATGERSL